MGGERERFQQITAERQPGARLSKARKQGATLPPVQHGEKLISEALAEGEELGSNILQLAVAAQRSRRILGHELCLSHSLRGV